ncbi:hypothetical protein niasHT_024464 [Heterodera trifolii]|uniref:Protein aurora borealis n=1 Tax=Heterodera trifolii TaxID=157864 RepID=A0ABD2JYI1_9BILA
MSNDKKDESSISTNTLANKEKSTIIQESSFVTPGIFRRRKMLTGRQLNDEGNNEAKDKSEEFKWSIDQIAKIQPIEFDETEEFSLPPENWDPCAKFKTPQFENIDHFWTHNNLIAPSPELFATASALRRVQPSVNSPTTSPFQLALSPFDSGPSCSSKCSLSDSTFMSPTMMLTHSQMSESAKAKMFTAKEKLTPTSVGNGDTKENMIADGSADFELLERSLSFEVADCIAADMDDGEGFVFMEMRKEGPSVDLVEE